jgi:predicted Zn-dependent peptidase
MENQKTIGHYPILPHVDLHIQKTEQFKTNFFGLNFKRPLSRREATYATLMSAIMTKCSEIYPKTTEFSKALDGLYGTAIYADVEKYGELLSLQFKVVFPKDAHLPEAIQGDVLDFVKDLLFKPAFLSPTFDSGIFEMEKKALLDEYASRKNDRVTYSYDRLIEEMCATEDYRFYKYGDEATLKEVSIEGMKDYYRALLETSHLDIFAVGDFETDGLVSALKAYPLKITYPVPTTFSGKYSISNVERYFNEHDVLQQAKLNMGYRLPIDRDSASYYGAVVMSFILGNGVNSYLFKILREKENLCYYAFSRYEGYKSLMVIGSGIEPANTQKAIQIINEGVAWVQRGDFTDEDLSLAKKAIIKSLESSQDGLHSLAGFMYSQLLRGNDKGLEGYKAHILAVDRDLVIEVSQQLALDMIYLLSAEEVTL